MPGAGRNLEKPDLTIALTPDFDAVRIHSRGSMESAPETLVKPGSGFSGLDCFGVPGYKKGEPSLDHFLESLNERRLW
jgi:hypothetical protein